MKYKQRYWLRAIVQTDRDDGRDSRQYRNVPYRVEVDFDRIFAERGISGRLDRHSVCVVKAGDNDCEAGLRETHYYLSEEWLCGNKGTIHWLIDEIGEEPLEYRIYYDSTDSGPFAPPAYIGLVGDGDALRFNDGRAHPLHVGLAANPIAIDWDGDGAIDIISPQIYSHAAGSPWHVVRFFRNEGSNERPLFGEGIALTADIAGRREPIRTGYCIELCDMNGDGLPDLLNCAYTDADNRLQVFVNTGERDDITGLPRLRLDDTVPLGLSGQIICIRAIDLHGDGRISLLVGYITQAQYADIDDPLWFTATDEQKRQAQWPRWYYRSYIALYENNAPAAGQLSFAPPVTLLADDGLPISYYTCANFEVVNHTGGMAFDLLVNSHAPNLHEGYLTLAYYKHAGEGRRPVFAKAGTIGGLADRNSLIVRQCRNAAFDGLLVVPGASGGKIVHYRCVGTNEAGLPQYEREGYVQQRNAYVHAHAGYAQGQAIDDDGDGDWDIVAGCETGFVTRIGNSGT
ncbi:MAG: VCBS repeat-containing protein, partial [Paenibacillaceae bacterium]|nr:VCBS repeat-containing protein [Paenibacillaceae bacterium]